MKRGFNIIVFLICLLIVFSVAFIGGIFTSGSTNSAWYESVKPSITPPNWVFPIVWNILFLLIAVSLYLAWTHSENKSDRKNVALTFGTNLVLNILWSFLYFGIRNPLAALIEIFFLWISIFAMIYVTFRIDKKSSYLLIPYLLWVTFAIVLNYLSV